MRLVNLLKNIKCKVFGNNLINITGLYHNDKDVKKGGLFFCLKGSKFSGIDYVKSAKKNGAVAIVCDSVIDNCEDVVLILVEDVRKSMSLIAKNFYGEPDKNLKLIGVTGTNGKTSTTYMIAGMLNKLGYSTAIVGTNGVIFKDKIIKTEMTTPDPIILYKILKQISNEKIEYVCMEISAHSIYLKKIEGLLFEVVIFTNLTEDHLDYFKDMNLYFCAKKEVFSKNYTKRALINTDDYYGKILFDSINIDKKAYSIINKNVDYYAENKKRTIILFSNIVSSIDKRKRFLVAGKVVLNVKLIL